MTKSLSPELKADVLWFAALLREKGGCGKSREIDLLIKAVEMESPVIDSRVKALVNNALSPDTIQYELTEDERLLIGGLMVRLADWREGRPGPPKLFPRRMNLRMSDTDVEALSNISKKTGEDNSEIIRRLIYEADAK